MKQVELLRTAGSEQAYLCRNALQVMTVDWSCQQSSRICSVTVARIKNVAMEGELMFVQSSAVFLNRRTARGSAGICLFCFLSNFHEYMLYSGNIERRKIFVNVSKNSDADSEVCHPCCVFKLYGEINSVKNTTVNIWLNGGVY